MEYVFFRNSSSWNFAPLRCHCWHNEFRLRESIRPVAIIILRIRKNAFDCWKINKLVSIEGEIFNTIINPCKLHNKVFVFLFDIIIHRINDYLFITGRIHEIILLRFSRRFFFSSSNITDAIRNVCRYVCWAFEVRKNSLKLFTHKIRCVLFKKKKKKSSPYHFFSLFYIFFKRTRHV